MSMEVEDWMRIQTTRTARDQRVQLRFEVAPSRVSGRDIIFRTLLPGVFIYLVAFYAFVFNPAVADFYCKGLRSQPQPQSDNRQMIIEEEAAPATGNADSASIV
jgi:hypothetical protein